MFIFFLEHEQVLLQKDGSQVKKNFKSPEMSYPRKDPIPNQDSTRNITQQDPKLPPHLEKGPTGHKPFIDDTHFSNPRENEHTYTTDNSYTDNEDSVDKTNIGKDEYKDNEYKEDHSEAPKSDEKKPKVE